MAKQWTSSDTEYIRSNYGHIPTPEIAEELGRNENSIRLKASELHLLMTNRGKWNKRESEIYWTIAEEEYLKSAYPLQATRIIADRLGKSTSAISQRARRLNIPKILRHCPRKPDTQKKYTVNHDCFSVLSPDIAYTLGFFVADGNVGHNRVKFSNANIDILSKIRDVLGSTHPISENRKSTHIWYDLTIVDRDLCNGIMAWGITPNKSLVASLPNVPDKLFPDFLRGYFDGDGSSRYDKHSGLIVKFTSGSKLLLDEIKDRIINLLGITGSEIACDKGRTNAWRLHYYGKRALALGDAMYKNANALYIQKKRDCFSAYAQYHLRVKSGLRWV